MALQQLVKSVKRRASKSMPRLNRTEIRAIEQDSVKVPLPEGEKRSKQEKIVAIPSFIRRKINTPPADHKRQNVRRSVGPEATKPAADDLTSTSLAASNGTVPSSLTLKTTTESAMANLPTKLQVNQNEDPSNSQPKVFRFLNREPSPAVPGTRNDITRNGQPSSLAGGTKVKSRQAEREVEREVMHESDLQRTNHLPGIDVSEVSGECNRPALVFATIGFELRLCKQQLQSTATLKQQLA